MHRAPTRIETIEYREKNKPKPTIGYLILSAVFSTIIFVAVYFLYILPRERDFANFALLFGLNLMAGILGSWIARLFTANWMNLSKTGQFINRQLLIALLYSLIVWFGLFNFVMARYIDINTMTIAAFLVYLLSREFMEIVAILLAVKALVYLFSDFLAVKSNFG